MNDPESRYLSLDLAADQLGLTALQVYARVRTGEIPAIKVGGKRQWRIDSCTLPPYVLEDP